MYIEPCCIDTQGPQLLRGAEHGFAFFQTSGDVTIEKFLRAMSSLAGSDHVLLLSMPETDVATLRTIRRYMERGWAKAVCIVTQSNQKELISGELAGLTAKVQYAADPLIIDGLMACFGQRRSLIIQGAMLSQADFALSLYAAYLGNRQDTIKAATEALLSKLRLKPLIDSRETNADIKALLADGWVPASIAPPTVS